MTLAKAILLSSMNAFAEDTGVQVDVQEIACMARAVYFEARGEDVVGQASVAWVIRNRKNDDRWGLTYCSVVKQPFQFSYRNNLKQNKNMPVILDNSIDEDSWKMAVDIALHVKAGYIIDPTGGAVYYFAYNKVIPTWAYNLYATAIHGEHVFMSDSYKGML